MTGVQTCALPIFLAVVEPVAVAVRVEWIGAVGDLVPAEDPVVVAAVVVGVGARGGFLAVRQSAAVGVRVGPAAVVGI